MIVTSPMVQNALSLLARPADGSRANEQAREQAKTVLENHVKSLEIFIARNPASQCSASMYSTIAKINEVRHD